MCPVTGAMNPSRKRKRPFCKEEGCKKYVRYSKLGNGKEGCCIGHGGGDRCKEPDCNNSARPYSKLGNGKEGYCIGHGGGDRCKEPGCDKSAYHSKPGKGKEGYCVGHGGGDRCKEPGCNNSAQSSKLKNGKEGYCKGHGGGNRCKEPGCNNSAQNSEHGIGKEGYCKGHGGGNRCKEPGCDKSAEHSKSDNGKEGYCIGHGGGDRCKEPGCNKSARKFGNGKEGYCVSHGGGNRCQGCCANLATPSVAKYVHPITGLAICTGFARGMIDLAKEKGDEEAAANLMRYFGFKKHLVLRAEHVFYHNLVKTVPELAELRRVLDEPIIAALMGGPKKLKDERPDYFHFYAQTNTGLHGEFDEREGHEDCELRLQAIAHHAGCGIDRVFVFRVQGHLEDPGGKALLVRREHRDVRYYTMTPLGHKVLEQVAVHVRACLADMKAGTCTQPRKVVFSADGAKIVRW